MRITVQIVCALLIALLLLCAQGTDAKVKKKKIAARLAQEKLLQQDNAVVCMSDEDCPYAPCQTTTCVNNECVSAKVICPQPSNPCSYSLGCDAQSDQCRYSQLVCDDNNPCTIDQCAKNNSEHSYCMHTPVPDCDSSATHSVSFRVENANHLNVDVYESDGLIEFCQSSTLVDPTTSVIVGFDPYVPCKLHERGTCDNKLSYASTPSFVRFIDTQQTDSSSECNVDAQRRQYTLAIEGVTDSLLWAANEDATFSALPMKDGQQIHGYLVDELNPGLVLRVDIVLKPNPYRTTVKEMADQCYDSAGIDTVIWSTYDISYGTLTAAHDTQYVGLVYSIERGAAQVGHGASGRNAEWGIYMSMDLKLANQPHDRLLELNTLETTAIMRTNLIQTAAVPVDYCGLFKEPRQTAINEWSPRYNSASHTVTYCRNFTLNEMLKCRSYNNKYATLFQAITDDSVEDEHVNFAGTVYQTTVQPRGECSTWNDDMCGERILSTTSYNITVVTNESGVRRVDIVHSDFEFNIKWIENRWICCGTPDSGNLRVIVETEVSGEKRMLINPRVNFADETGYPLSFEIDDEVPPCSKAYTDKCVQRWTLSTVNGADVVDFSGIKPLLWDVFERRSIIAHVTAAMTLRARHIGSQIHLDDGRVSAALKLYTDRNLRTPFDENKTPDGTTLFGSICLDGHRHLDLIANEIAVCYSLKHDLDDNECEKKVVLYSRHDNVNASMHAFEFISNPPMAAHCVGFSFVTRAYSKFRQSMHVEYSVQEASGDGSLIELWHDDDDADDDDWHHSVYHSYHSYCPHAYSFDWDHYHCHEYHDDDGSVAVFAIVILGIFVILIGACFFTSYVPQKPVRSAAKWTPVSFASSSEDDEDSHVLAPDLRDRLRQRPWK